MPDTPAAPTTLVQGSDILISWVAPDSKGSEILGYQIFIQENDGDFSVDVTNCDGSDAEIMSSSSCLVPIALLIESTYQLPWGSSINAKVQAYNFYGYSGESAIGNGAIILTYPDSPIGLAETVALRAPTSISFTWS